MYIEDVDRFVDPLTWSTFASVFPNIWTAGAFKGAFGERLYMTNIQRHVGNQMAWLDVMRRESQGSNRINFRGLVLTGWSRYNHFAVLCELLPSSLPSIVLNLLILREGALDFKVEQEANKLLQCSSMKAMMTQEELSRSPEQWDLHRCKFPGSDLFTLLSSYDVTKREIESLNEKVTQQDGWMTDYNVRHGFSSADHVFNAMRPISYLSTSVRSLEGQARNVLSEYFDQYTTEEWIEQHILPLHQMIEVMNERAGRLTSANTWPRRPLPIFKGNQVE